MNTLHFLRKRLFSSPFLKCFNMKIKRCVCLLLLFLFPFVVLFILLSHPLNPTNLKIHKNEQLPSDKNLHDLLLIAHNVLHHKMPLKLSHCHIPIPNLSNYYLEKMSKEEMPSCKHQDNHYELKDGMLRISSLDANTDLTYECCISDVLRPNKLAKDDYSLSSCEHIGHAMNVSEKQYFGVKCTVYMSLMKGFKFFPESELLFSDNEMLIQGMYRKSIKSKLVRYGEKMHMDLYANVLMTPGITFKAKYWELKPEKAVNILMIVLDSTSRMDAYRYLQKTLTFLLHKLQFVDFKGYHVQGEQAMSNTIPLLMGMDASEFRNKLKPKWNEFWDEYPFIWKEFHSLNYVTGYIEDLPHLGTFNHGGQRGFKYQPTDIYTRPLMSAFTYENSIQSFKKMCFGERNMAKFLLDYQFDIMTKLHKVPKFIITWPYWPQHDYYTSLAAMDNTYFEFFHKIANYKKNILEDTVIIFMSDNGFKNHPYSNTHEGLIERRLPLLMIRLPQKLTTKFPNILQILKTNANRVTTHFDTYQTLIHLLEISGGRPPDVDPSMIHPGQSLLKSLPENRTCADAYIPENYCACNLPNSPQIDETGVRRIPELVKIKLSF